MMAKTTYELNDTPFEETGKTIKENPKKIKAKSDDRKENQYETPAEPYAIRDAHYAALLWEYKQEFKDRRTQTYKIRSALFWVMLILLCFITMACLQV